MVAIAISIDRGIGSTCDNGTEMLPTPPGANLTQTTVRSVAVSGNGSNPWSRNTRSTCCRLQEGTEPSQSATADEKSDRTRTVIPVNLLA